MGKFDSLCVHPVTDYDNFGGAVTSPVFPSVAYNYLETEDLQYPGFYSTFNQKRLGEIMARLEHGAWGVAFSSGMAAISAAILSFLKVNDHVIFSKDLYGGTWKFVEQELPRRGISFSYADNNIANVESLLNKDTKMIYIETPSNPLLNIFPLEEIAKFAKRNSLISIVDNTFASPINQLPLEIGIDIVVHSGTKYLGGHNDLPFGALVSNSHAHKDPIFSTARMYGGSLSPSQCQLAERSLKTLAIRLQRQNENALKVARYLESHSLVQKVYYPGLTSHKDYRIARQQMTGFGGMLSFELKMKSEELTRFLNSLSMVKPALSLGGVESLICSPSATSHKGLSPGERENLGINDNLVRLSVGVEDALDIIDDLRLAIVKAFN